MAIGQPLCNLSFGCDRLRAIRLRVESLVLSGLEACHKDAIPCPAPSMLTAREHAMRFPATGVPARGESEAEALARHDLSGTTNRSEQLNKPRQDESVPPHGNGSGPIVTYPV